MGESDAAYAKRMKAEKQARKAEKQARKAERKAKRAAKAAAGNPRTQQEASAEPPPKKQKKAHVAELDIAPASPDRAVDTGEPGHTPKVVHAVDSQTTPLAEREAAAAAAASAAAAAKSTDQQQLAAHATQVAEEAEETGGFAASKGGMALVGLVARTIAESPALGVKNLYKKVCETLGERPGSGRAPNSREVRKIVAALKESKGLETVMDAVSPYTSETKRAALVQKKIEAGPKDGGEGGEGGKKLFVGNLPYDIQHEEDCKTLRQFFEDGINAPITDVCLLTNESSAFAGTGFVEFATAEAAKAALGLHGKECGGRKITLHYAKPRKEKPDKHPLNEGLIAQPQRDKPEGCRVVFVGNLRFDIDPKEVRTWAAECGAVESIRWLTDKHTKRFKGCGYIEFGAESADAAVEAMVGRNGALLKGRPVRVDYADNERGTA